MKLQRSNHRLFLYDQKEKFTVGGTRLTVEDRIPFFTPWRGERILRIYKTSAYYSTVPLAPFRHRLLCYNYCEDALKKQGLCLKRHALILGCGGGAMPRWLLQKYPSLSVDVVDFSPEIIEICKKYFLKKWNHSARLTYYCTDAKDYDPPGYPYQFIFCDLFDGSELAPLVYSQSFAQKLRGMMEEDGLLVINCGFGLQEEILRVYQTVFPSPQIVDRKPWQTQVITARAKSGSPVNP